MKALAVSNENKTIIEQLNFILDNGNQDHLKQLADTLDLIIENMKSDKAPSGIEGKAKPREVFLADASQHIRDVGGMLNTLLFLHDSGLGLEEPNPSAVMVLTQAGLRDAIDIVNLIGKGMMKHFGNVEGIVRYLPIEDDGE